MFRIKGLPNARAMEIMFESTVATRKHAWTPKSQISKESTEGFGDSFDSKEFVDPQCQSPIVIDPMDVECPLVSRASPEINKEKGLARNVQLFKGIHKRHGKKHLVVQEMSNTLKSMTNVIIESKSASSHASFTSAITIEVQSVMEMVLSLPRVQSRYRLHMFSSLFFIENQSAKYMFVSNEHDKMFQLFWLEKQYEKKA